VKTAITDIIHNSACKKMCVLQYHSKRTAEVCLLDFVYIDAVVPDLAVLDIIETVNQICNCRLSCSGAPYKGNLLSGSGVQLDIVKNHLVIRIAEVHVIEGHIALQLCIRDSSVSLM